MTQYQTKVGNFLNKAVIFSLYLFALGLLTSKALTSAGGVLVCFFGLLRVIILQENPIKTLKEKTLNLPILFLTISLLLSFIKYPDAEAFSQLQKHLLLFLFFYFAVANLHNLEQIKRLVIISCVSMGIALVYDFYQHYFLDVSRVTSFSSALAFGCLLNIFMIFTLVYGFWGKINIGKRIALFSGTALMGVALLLTQTRGSWLALIGGTVALSWLKNKKILILLFIVCLLLSLLLPPTYVDRFKSSFDLKTNSSNLTRIALWKSALLMYRDHLITGVGLNRFSPEYEINYRQPYPVDTSCHPHNNILLFMAETGTFGFVSFVWLMATIFIWLYKNYLQITDPNWRLFPFASFCGLIVFHLQGLTEVNYGDAETIRFFWFLMVLNAAIVKILKTTEHQKNQPSSG
ncbi:MAG: O-antigen ligase family protein [Firmicutes bacterium]|nr:O-antigen ligase family protein [Bacillota bacterium]